MADKLDKIVCTTPEFRVSYPHLFKPSLNKFKKCEEYSVLALFKKSADLTALKKAAHLACVLKFGEDQTKWPKKLINPFKTHKEDGSVPDALEEGGTFMSFVAKVDFKPTIVDERLQEVIEPRKFYAGCYAKASVRAYAYAFEGIKCGVGFGLSAVQFVRDGEPLGGARVRIEDAFEPVDVEASAAADLF